MIDESKIVPYEVTRADNGSSGYMKSRGGTARMTVVAMVGRQFMGVPNTDPILQKASAYVMERGKPPVWQAGGRNTFYYWYYGTLAMFQMGGDHWKNWNKALKPALLDNQRKGGPLDGSAADVDGSWDLLNVYDKRAGRVYTTAVGALCLEVYYRYLPMYSK